MRIDFHAIPATLAVITLLFVSALSHAQETEVTRAIEGGGIFVDGWKGKIDAGAEADGQTVADSKFFEDGGAMHFITGPAASYWNPANTASGSYTVKATFTEPKFMNRNDHPHPYGVFVGGNNLGTANQSYLYCAAYGNGNFIVRGFGPEPFRMNGRGGTSPAVNKAAAQDEPVKQEIAISVSSDKVECVINGTVVGSYPRADVVAEGKLQSPDGLYGVRVGHNTEGLVTGLAVTKH